MEVKPKPDLLRNTRGAGAVEWLVVVAGLVGIAVVCFLILRAGGQREAHCIEDMAVSGQAGPCGGSGSGTNGQQAEHGGRGGAGDGTGDDTRMHKAAEFGKTFGKCVALGALAKCEGWAGNLGSMTGSMIPFMNWRDEAIAAYQFVKDPSWGTGINLALNTVGTVPVAGAAVKWVGLAALEHSGLGAQLAKHSTQIGHAAEALGAKLFGKGAEVAVEKASAAEGGALLGMAAGTTKKKAEEAAERLLPHPQSGAHEALMAGHTTRINTTIEANGQKVNVWADATYDKATKTLTVDDINVFNADRAKRFGDQAGAIGSRPIRELRRQLAHEAEDAGMEKIVIGPNSYRSGPGVGSGLGSTANPGKSSEGVLWRKRAASEVAAEAKAGETTAANEARTALGRTEADVQREIKDIDRKLGVTDEQCWDCLIDTSRREQAGLREIRDNVFERDALKNMPARTAEQEKRLGVLQARTGTLKERDVVHLPDVAEREEAGFREARDLAARREALRKSLGTHSQ